MSELEPRSSETRRNVVLSPAGRRRNSPSDSAALNDAPSVDIGGPEDPSVTSGLMQEPSEAADAIEPVPDLTPAESLPEQRTAGEADSRYASPLAKARAADRALMFVQALRWLREEAGLSLKDVSDNAGAHDLPKSTVHYMTQIPAGQPEKTRLPARQESVELYVRGCDRPAAEVRAWAAEWRRLKSELRRSKEKTVRIRAIKPPAPSPSERTTEPADVSSEPIPECSEPSSGPTDDVESETPADSNGAQSGVWGRIRRWLGQLTHIVMLVTFGLAVLKLVVGNVTTLGLSEFVRSVLVPNSMSWAMGAATTLYGVHVYFRISRHLGSALQNLIRRVTRVLVGERSAQAARAARSPLP